MRGGITKSEAEKNGYRIRTGSVRLNRPIRRGEQVIGTRRLTFVERVAQFSDASLVSLIVTALGSIFPGSPVALIFDSSVGFFAAGAIGLAAGFRASMGNHIELLPGGEPMRAAARELNEAEEEHRSATAAYEVHSIRAQHALPAVSAASTSPSPHAALPRRAARLAEEHREALPAEANQAMSAIAELTQAMRSDLESESADSPLAQRARALLDNHVPELLRDYRGLTEQAANAPLYGRETPGQRLVGGLRGAQRELNEIHRSMQADRARRVAERSRYLELRAGGPTGEE